MPLKTRFGAVLGGSKCFKIVVYRGAVRLLGASWGILASEVRPRSLLGPVLRAFWSRHVTYWGRPWGDFERFLKRLGVFLGRFCWPRARLSVLNGSQLCFSISDAIE